MYVESCAVSEGHGVLGADRMVFGSMLTHHPISTHLPTLRYGLRFMRLARSGNTLSFSSADTRWLAKSFGYRRAWTAYIFLLNMFLDRSLYIQALIKIHAYYYSSLTGMLSCQHRILLIRQPYAVLRLLLAYATSLVVPARDYTTCIALGLNLIS